MILTVEHIQLVIELTVIQICDQMNGRTLGCEGCTVQEEEGDIELLMKVFIRQWVIDHYHQGTGETTAYIHLLLQWTMDEHNMEAGQVLAEGAIQQGHRTRHRR